MTQLFHSLPSEKSQRILCCYVNGTTQTLVARIADTPNCHFERVVFPKERVLFEAPLGAHLEIHRNTEMGITLSDSIPCNYLRVQEESSTGKAMELSTISRNQMVSSSKIA